MQVTVVNPSQKKNPTSSNRIFNTQDTSSGGTSQAPTNTSIPTGTTTIGNVTYRQYTDTKTGQTFLGEIVAGQSGGGSRSTSRPADTTQSNINNVTPSALSTVVVRRTAPRDIPKEYWGKVIMNNELNKYQWYDTYKVYNKPLYEKQMTDDMKKQEENRLAEIRRNANRERNETMKKLTGQEDYFVLNQNIKQNKNYSYVPGEAPRLASEGRSGRQIAESGKYNVQEIVDEGVAKFNEDSLMNELKHANTYSKINEGSKKFIADLQSQYDSGKITAEEANARQQEYYAQIEDKVKQADAAYYAQQSYLADKYKFDTTRRIEQHQQDMSEFALLAITPALGLGFGAGAGLVVRGVTALAGQTAGTAAGLGIGGYFGYQAVKSVGSELSNTLYQASIGNYRPLLTMAGDTAIGFVSGGIGYKFTAPKLIKNQVTYKNKKVNVETYVKDLTVGKVEQVGTDSFGNKLWRGEVSAKIVVADAQTGKPIKVYRSKALSDVISSETESGAIESFSNSVSRTTLTEGKGRVGSRRDSKIYASADKTKSEGFFQTVREDTVSTIVDTTKQPDYLFQGVTASSKSGKVSGSRELFPTLSRKLTDDGPATKITNPITAIKDVNYRIKPKSVGTIVGKIRKVGVSPRDNPIFMIASRSANTPTTYKVKGYRRVQKSLKSGMPELGVPGYSFRFISGTERAYRKPQKITYQKSTSFIEAIAKKDSESPSGDRVLSKKYKFDSKDLISKSLAQETAKAEISNAASLIANKPAPTKTVVKVDKKVTSRNGFTGRQVYQGIPEYTSIYSGTGQYEQSVTSGRMPDSNIKEYQVNLKDRKSLFSTDLKSDFNNPNNKKSQLGFNLLKPDEELTGFVPYTLIDNNIKSQSRGGARDRNAQRSRIETKQIESLKTQQVTSPALTITPTPINITPRDFTDEPPVPPKIVEPKRVKEDRLTVSEFGFIPFAKVGKRERQLTSRPVSRSRALAIGSEFTDITLAKSFRIQPTKVKVKSERLQQPNLYKFRTYQQKRGKKKYTPFTFYEKRQYALEPGEQRMIRPLKVTGIKKAAQARRSSLGLF